jgi:glycosyltransferase involved in cell wall biosynthesis
VKGEEAPAEWDRYRAAVHRGLHAADLVVAPSNAMMAALLQNYGRLPRTEVIYNGRQASRYAARAKRPYILSAGRLWDEAKNVAALKSVADDLPWPIRIAGDGGEDGAANLQWLGRLDETSLATEMSTAAIYALPAMYEPFGLSILEAALSRCALVLSDIPSLREIWEDAAVYVNPRDPEALRDTLRQLIATPNECQRLAVAGQRRGARYSVNAMARGYLQAFQGLQKVPSVRVQAPLPVDQRIIA